MQSHDPVSLVESFVAAMNRQDVDQAVAHYEPDAVLIAEPGQVVEGARAIRDALEGMVAGRPLLTTRSPTVIVCGDLALYHAAWTMKTHAPDGSTFELTGRSADVLRRQSSGEWRIAVDNPWGTAAPAE